MTNFTQFQKIDLSSSAISSEDLRAGAPRGVRGRPKRVELSLESISIPIHQAEVRETCVWKLNIFLTFLENCINCDNMNYFCTPNAWYKNTMFSYIMHRMKIDKRQIASAKCSSWFHADSGIFRPNGDEYDTKGGLIGQFSQFLSIFKQF